MSIKSRTIDNLGVEASIQYAENERLYDQSLMEGSKIVSKRAEIPSVKPYAPSEGDRFFSIGKAASWALFSPPPNFFVYGETLFSYLLIPSLGTQEKQEADLEKIEQYEDVLSKQKRGKKRGSDQEKEEEDKEKETLLALFQLIKRLDKTLSLINARRSQYQRG